MLFRMLGVIETEALFKTIASCLFKTAYYPYVSQFILCMSESTGCNCSSWSVYMISYWAFGCTYKFSIPFHTRCKIDCLYLSCDGTMHEANFFQAFHRTDCCTKHANALFSAYTDHEEKPFDVVGVPWMTYLCLYAIGLPISFFSWWICYEY